MNPIITPTNREMAIYPREKFRLGSVEEYKVVNPKLLDIPNDLTPSEIYQLEISDPCLKELACEQIEYVNSWETLGDSYAASRREKGYWARKADTAYSDEHGVLFSEKKQSWGDPVSSEAFFSSLGNLAFNEWRSLIPSAIALTYLSDPNEYTHIYSIDGNPLCEIDDKARAWLTACTDAKGIRSRATVLAELVSTFINERKNDPDSLKWMSIACGTALPAMKAATKAGIKPELTLVDIDRLAMSNTEELGEKIGFEGVIKQRRVNIFNPLKMAKLKDSLGVNGGRPRIIDMMGIFEYTGENLNIDPSVFLKSCYDILHPGGRLIFGQMRDDRPNADFTMGVIGWPVVMMRSPREVLEIIAGANIDPQNVKLFLPSDGVYSIVSVDKPINPIG